MRGYQLTFFTRQDRTHRGQPLAHWLVGEARAIGIGGATLVGASEGFGHRRRIHSAYFVDLAEQPVEVVMAVTAVEGERLFARLNEEKVRVFYSKIPVEFGMTGEEDEP